MTKKKLHVKNTDRVMIIAGKDKGKDGNIKKVDVAKGTVTVEGLNMVTKAQKPQPMAGIQGGLIKVEAPVDASNVMVICPACENRQGSNTQSLTAKKFVFVKNVVNN